MRGLRLGVETTIENELSEMILMMLPIYLQNKGKKKKTKSNRFISSRQAVKNVLRVLDVRKTEAD